MIIGVSLITLIVPILAIIFAPLLAYYASVKRSTKKIEQTWTHDLMVEASAIREDYRDDNDKLRTRIDNLNARLDTLSVENIALHTTHRECQLRVDILEQRLLALGGNINGGS